MSITNATIALAIEGVFGGGSGGTSGSSSGNGTLKKWLDRLADALIMFEGKTIEALTVIVGSIVGAILSFFGKAVGFVAENTWAIIVFVAGLIAWWLMQNVQRK